MISLEQISGEIAVLEEEKPTHVTMQKLANLYTVRDHMVLDTQSQPIAAISEVVVPVSDSEFMQSVDGMSFHEFMEIIDELITTLMVINPKLYSSVIKRIKGGL